MSSAGGGMCLAARLRECCGPLRARRRSCSRRMICREWASAQTRMAAAGCSLTSARTTAAAGAGQAAPTAPKPAASTPGSNRLGKISRGGSNDTVDAEHHASHPPLRSPLTLLCSAISPYEGRSSGGLQRPYVTITQEPRSLFAALSHLANAHPAPLSGGLLRRLHDGLHVQRL